MIILGIVLVPIIVLFIKKLWAFDTAKVTRILLHCGMAAVSVGYLFSCFILKIEPFDFVNTEPMDYVVDTAIITLFSPCLWFVIFYYTHALFSRRRVRKNSKVKTERQYAYYRDDLNKIAPGMLMFTYSMNTDVRKSISATILKLKLDGYITEQNGELVYAGKEDGLTESEKIVLRSIRNKNFDVTQYKKTIEQESLDCKFIKKNTKGLVLKIAKMLITIMMPFLLFFASEKFDTYVFNTFEIYDMDNVRYLKITDEDEIDHLYYEEVKNLDDYYHSYNEDNDHDYFNYSLIKADRWQYRCVRKMILFNALDVLLILTTIIMVFVAISMLGLQIRYFNKDYIRTKKGNDLINKAYALKNYRTEYSLMKDRTEAELVLWEYYLVYAVALDVNVTIEDELIQKYLETIHY